MFLKSLPKRVGITLKLCELFRGGDMFERLACHSHWSRLIPWSGLTWRPVRNVTVRRTDDVAILIPNEGEIHAYDIPPPCRL